MSSCFACTGSFLFYSRKIITNAESIYSLVHQTLSDINCEVSEMHSSDPLYRVIDKYLCTWMVTRCVRFNTARQSVPSNNEPLLMPMNVNVRDWSFICPWISGPARPGEFILMIRKLCDVWVTRTSEPVKCCLFRDALTLLVNSPPWWSLVPLFSLPRQISSKQWRLCAYSLLLSFSLSLCNVFSLVLIPLTIDKWREKKTDVLQGYSDKYSWINCL